MRIKMLTTVRSDIPFLTKPDTILCYGEEYDAISNKNGAVSGICANGEKLGVRPGEFEFLSIPEWLFEVWNNVYPFALDNAVLEVES